MGSILSTRWRKNFVKALTVEETFILDIQALSTVLPSPIRPGMHHWGHLPIFRFDDVECIPLSYELDLRRPDCPFLLIQFAHPESQEYTTSRIVLQKVTLPRNGYRWRFLCPALQKNPGCKSQLRRKLYLPPLTRPTFVCQLCAGPLTWLSSQQSHSKYAGVSSEFKALLIRDQARKKARKRQAL